jgi:aspartate/methionine/tyrosine aminotransferase
VSGIGWFLSAGRGRWVVRVRRDRRVGSSVPRSRSPFEAVQQAVREADRDVLDLSSGSPDWAPPEALREGLRTYAECDPSAFDYPPIAGLPALRAWIATHHDVDREQVLVTTGASEANFLAVAAALAENDGDTVVVPDPAYPYYGDRARLLGGRLGRLTLGPTGELDAEDIEALAGPDPARVEGETAAVVLNTPNNPTGAVYDQSTMAEVAGTVDAADATLISDEVYAPFDRSGQFTSARAVTDDAVLVGGFSKALAITGFRVGYGIFPPRLLETARRYHRLCTLTASRPAQAAVLAALETLDDGEGLSDLVADARRRLGARSETLERALADVGDTVVSPAGGFYVLVDLPGVPGTVDGVRRLIEEAGVAAMPGAVFGETTAEYVRFSLTAERVETAAERLRAWSSAQ